MDNGTPDRPRWKFDPNTGQPLGDEPPPGEPTQPIPSQSIPQPQGESFRVSSQSTPDDATTSPQYYPPPTEPQPQYTPPPEPPYTGQYNTQPQPTAVEPTQPQQVNVEKRRSSRVPLVIGIGALVLVAVLAAGGWYVYQNVLNRPAVAVERLLPTNTLAYFSFDPVLEGSQKEAMDKIGQTFQSQPGFQEAWTNFTALIADALPGEGSDGATPSPSLENMDALTQYLGNNVTLALLPPSSDDLDKLESATEDDDLEQSAIDVLGRNVVGIVDLDFNPLNKKGPITDLKREADNAGKAELAERYRDVDIRKFVTNTNEIYFTLLDGTSTAIVGAKPEPLRVVIDDYKDNRSLRDSTTFRELSGQVPQERIAALYLNLSEIYRQAKLAAPDALESNNIQDANGAMLLTLSAANDGMQVDIATEADLSVMGTGLRVNPGVRPDVRTLTDIPNESLAFFAGTDLASTIKSTLDGLRNNQDADVDIDAQIEEFERQAGVSLEDDILPLLGGDYVFSVSLDDLSGITQPSATLQIKLKDSSKAQQVLDRLAYQASGGDAEKISLAGGTFYAPEPGEGVLIGVAQNRFWLVYDADVDSATARIDQTVAELGKGLGTTAAWRDTAMHLPRDSNTIAYVDLRALREYFERETDTASSETYDKDIAPFLKPIKYLLVGSAEHGTSSVGTSSVGSRSRNHTVLFVGINGQ